MSNEAKAPQGNPGDIVNWPMLKIQYRTDPDKIAALLPPGIEPGAQANVNLKKPRLQVGRFNFSLAPVTGKNPCAIYVKDEGAYIGKMIKGEFFGRAQAETLKEILDIASDPVNKAIEHGKLTGRCAMCMRKLSLEESVDRAMGKVCAEKFFGKMLTK